MTANGELLAGVVFSALEMVVVIVLLAPEPLS